MNIWGVLMVISGCLLLLSAFVGYPICHIVLGPKLFKKHNIRNYKESFGWFGNIFTVEHDLKSLALKNVEPKASQILKVINYSKTSLIINVFLFVLFAILNISTQN